MNTKKIGDIITAGLAAFSMFFGAGNIVYPLMIGRLAGSLAPLALTGLLITTVGLPLLGLIAMSYFDGDYQAFFDRLGKIPSIIFISIIMALIGPFGATPRLITVSFAALSSYMPSISLMQFSLISIILIYAFTIKKSTILDILGNVLSPMLLGALALIIFKGLSNNNLELPVSSLTKTQAFFDGLLVGYNMMDLFASIFFASIILSLLKIKFIQRNETPTNSSLARSTALAGIIAISLLGIIYMGLGMVSAFYAPEFEQLEATHLLTAIAIKLLGHTGSFVAAIAVTLACLTTAISLVAVFTDFICNQLANKKLNYATGLIITLSITAYMATLGFNGIQNFLTPFLAISYPALITLTICNIAFKTKQFKPVKIPVALTTVIATAWYFLS